MRAYAPDVSCNNNNNPRQSVCLELAVARQVTGTVQVKFKQENQLSLTNHASTGAISFQVKQ